MPNQEVGFEVDGHGYAIRFTQNALYRATKMLGKSLTEAAATAGVVEVQTLLWAGLEGARLKHADRTEPYSLDEAGDLIDGLGGLQHATTIVVEALRLGVTGKVEGTQEVAAALAHPTRMAQRRWRDVLKSWMTRTKCLPPRTEAMVSG